MTIKKQKNTIENKLNYFIDIKRVVKNGLNQNKSYKNILLEVSRKFNNNLAYDIALLELLDTPNHILFKKGRV